MTDPQDSSGSVDRFLRSKSGGAATTAATYAARLRRYTEWNGDEGIDRDRYDRYMEHIAHQGRRPNGRALDSVILRVYAQFLGLDTRGWQKVGWRDVATEWIADGDYERLRAAAHSSIRDGEDRAFSLDFLRGTGLRIGEFLALRWRDVDLEEGRVVVRSGKGGRHRVIPLPTDGPPEMERALDSAREAFWRAYPDKTLGEARGVTAYVWPDRSRMRFENWLAAVGTRAGLPLRTHPHLLRHSFGTGLTMRGIPAPVVQRLLGHASLATTGRYTRATGADLLVALRRSGAPKEG